MNVKVCPSCGHEIYDRGKFCPFCGCELKGGKAVAVPEAKPADGETWNPESAYARKSPARVSALFLLLGALIAGLVIYLVSAGVFDSPDSGNWSRVNIRAGMSFGDALKQMKQAGFKENGEEYVSQRYRQAVFDSAEVCGNQTVLSVLEVTEGKDAQVIVGHVFNEPKKGSLQQQGPVFRDLKNRLTKLYGEPLEYNMSPFEYYMWNAKDRRVMLSYLDKDTVQMVINYAESI